LFDLLQAMAAAINDKSTVVANRRTNPVDLIEVLRCMCGEVIAHPATHWVIF
jgi:hypothetical protein